MCSSIVTRNWKGGTTLLDFVQHDLRLQWLRPRYVWDWNGSNQTPFCYSASVTGKAEKVFLYINIHMGEGRI